MAEKSYPAQRLHAAWIALPADMRGVIWISAGTLIFALNDIIVKTLGTAIHPVEMTFFRYVFGFLFLAPMFLHMGPEALRTQRLRLHIGRAIIAGVGQAGVYYAVVHLMLADATALAFTRPLFLTLLAVVFLREVVSWRRWTATAAGFVGVLVMIRPGHTALDPATLVALASAALFAAALTIIRHLSTTEPPLRILFYYHMFNVPLFAIPLVWLWKTPVGVEWLMLASIGAMTCVGMVCFIRAFSIGQASILGPIEYTRLIYAAIFGHFIFAEVPDMWSWAGAAIIIASALYIARREARQRLDGR